MDELTGGQALVSALVSEGVEVIFGIPGTHSLAIYDALADCPAIKHILVRHEQGAGYMADGYARSTGRVGVCLTTTGPAAVNAFAALATAYGDSCPVLLLCTQIPSPYIDQDKGVFHEIPNQSGMLERLTKFCVRPDSGQQIADAVHEAFRMAWTGRPRPVALELPADVLQERWAVKDSGLSSIGLIPADAHEIERSAEIILNSERPVVWAGGGVVLSGAQQELVKIAELLQAPVLTTNMGKTAIPADHPLCLGNVATEKAVRKYLESCDLLIAVGMRFSYLATEHWTLQLPEQIIHFDIDPTVIGKNYGVTQGVGGNARTTLGALADQLAMPAAGRPLRTGEVAELRNSLRAAWLECVPAGFEVIQAIREALPRNAIIAGDPTVCSYLAWRMLDLYEPRSYLYPMGCATLGYGFPAALGAKVAYPDRPVLAICGDGGFQFSCQELATAVQHHINIVTLIFNDHGYGVLRVQQDDAYGRRTQVDLVNPDFVSLAESYGAYGFRAEDVDHLKEAIDQALTSDSPVLIEMPMSLSMDKVTA
jgi:acetolactate synthase-1/2/3 large subunit